MKKKSVYLVMLSMALILGLTFSACDNENNGVSVPEWAQGEWYAPKYPSNPELGLWSTPTAVITSSQISFTGTTLACTSVSDNEVVFGTNSIVKIQKGNNDKEIIMKSTTTATLYALGAY